MRWIAGCVVAGVVSFGGATLLVKHLASKPSDPNLAELGISTSVEDIVAPAEPEASSELIPATGALEVVRIPDAGVLINRPPAPLFDPNVKPASFIDPNAAAHLDNSAFQWMPLCRDNDIGSSKLQSTSGRLPGAELMPRCEEVARPLPLPGPHAKAR